MKKKKHKSQYNIYISNETKDDTKIVIKGNSLNFRWIDKAVLIWSEDNTDDILRMLIEELSKVRGEAKK